MNNMTPSIEQSNITPEILPVGVTPVVETPVVEIPSNDTSPITPERVELVEKALPNTDKVKYLDLGVGFPVIDATDETKYNVALEALVDYMNGNEPL